jgi:nanoRNase/pAp phosphatase (c-di-AMP/oligoRNAs hydrolase)
LLDLGRFDRAGSVESYLVRNRAKKIIIDHHRPESVNADFVVVNPES